MIETVLAQLRFSSSILFGRPFHVASLERLLQGLLDTRREFGKLGSEAAEFISGPQLDEESRQEVQLHRFRSQAKKASRETSYYRRLFAEAGLDPRKLSYEAISHLPLTHKQALRQDEEAFICRSTRPIYRAMTTGTTGKPTSIWFSQREMQSYILLTAIGLISNGQIGQEDIVQISTSARAYLGNTTTMEGCARLGAAVYQTGVVAPEAALARLAEKQHIPGKVDQVSVLHTYPSYLGRLVECGLRLGYKPDDFGLHSINVGGELVSEGLKRRSQAVFGSVIFGQGYGMTEPWPFGGTLCEQGHLHFEISQGLAEVLCLEKDAPAQAGEPGRLVLTPFPPYRETTLLLRYDTQDIVTSLQGPLTCSLRNLPATSNLLGKQGLGQKTEQGWVFPRPIIEALEALEEVPLPARCSFWAASDGVAVQVYAPGVKPASQERIAENLATRGVPLSELYLVDEVRALHNPLPWRGDLHEASFGEGTRP